jgi:adenosylmethionine-8-amino-7-oxononanoate aminotransferase
MFPGDLNHVHFASGGAEANESSLKIARYYWFLKGQPEKTKILSRKQGYHGIAMGALAATGIDAYHQGFGPACPATSTSSALQLPLQPGRPRRGRLRRDARRGTSRRRSSARAPARSPP